MSFVSTEALFFVKVSLKLWLKIAYGDSVILCFQEIFFLQYNLRLGICKIIFTYPIVPCEIQIILLITTL